MKDKILIIGTGNMSRTYFRHFKFLGESPIMLFRNKESVNYKKAFQEFGESSLLDISEAENLHTKLLLSCVGPENHLKSIKNLVDKANLVAVEKPVSLDLQEIRDFNYKDSILF